ncbi:MAG: MauE/DoxX family redox-associated membrane protein [Acidimicrobiales bacterium]
MELIGPYLVACTLLVIAGPVKFVRPDDTARALVPITPAPLRLLLGFRYLRILIRAGALIEVAVGAVALFEPGPVPAALLAATYCAFAAVVLFVRSRGGAIASCGCFGNPDTPATRLHVVVNLVLGLSGVAVACDSPIDRTLAGAFAGQPLAGIPLAIACALCVWLTYLVLSSLPKLHAVRHLAGARAGRWR